MREYLNINRVEGMLWSKQDTPFGGVANVFFFHYLKFLCGHPVHVLGHTFASKPALHGF